MFGWLQQHGTVPSRTIQLLQLVCSGCPAYEHWSLTACSSGMKRKCIKMMMEEANAVCKNCRSSVHHEMYVMLIIINIYTLS